MNDSVSLGRHSVMGCDISHLFIFGITPLDSFLFWFCTRAVFRSLVYLGSKSHDLNIYYKDLVLQMTSVSLPNDPPLTSNFSLSDIAYLLRGYFRLFRSDQSCHLYCILKSLTIQIITHRTIITILATEITDVLLSEMDNPTARTPCVPNRLIWNPVSPLLAKSNPRLCSLLPKRAAPRWAPLPLLGRCEVNQLTGCMRDGVGPPLPYPHVWPSHGCFDGGPRIAVDGSPNLRF